MKKFLLIFSLMLVGGILIAQNKIEYPNTEPFMKFWQKLREYSANGKIDLNKNYDLRIRGDFPDKKISEGSLQFEINESSPEMKELLGNFLSAVDESKLLKIIALESLDEKVTSADLRIKFDAENADFKLSLKANSDKTAQKVASRFSLLLSITARFVAGSPEEEFYKNATVISEQNEIFVNGKISRQNLINYIRHGFMSEETKLEKAPSCYAVRYARPFGQNEPEKVRKYNLIDVCSEGKSKIVKTFNSLQEAEKFAIEHGITDYLPEIRRNISSLTTLEERILKKDTSCYVIVFAEPFEKKEFDKIYLPQFQLLDVCPEREPDLAYQEAKINIRREGKEFETSFDVVKIFANKAEAKEFADKYGVKDESMLLNNVPKCKLIRVIQMPLRKKNDKPTKPTIALLDICLPPDARNIQHPVITFEENGKKVSRIFEVIKTFVDKAEAEKYAEENNISDVEYGNQTESGKIDSDLPQTLQNPTQNKTSF